MSDHRVSYYLQHFTSNVRSGTLNYLSRTLWSSLGTNPGGRIIYRGYNNALATKEPDVAAMAAGSDSKQAKTREGGLRKRESLSRTVEDGTGGESSIVDLTDMQTEARSGNQDNEAVDFVKNAFERVQAELDTKKKSLQEESGPVVNAQQGDEPCTDLILVIHGIGQHLAAQYESFNFIYASNQLRHGLRKQSMDPRFASITDSRRCQVLPVQWRANLKLDSDDCADNEENERNNVFTVADITIGKSIPYVREVTNAVLLDIPLFMSDHCQRMIEAVCQQANRLYRLWIARHPHFEEHGRVHIIGHSVRRRTTLALISSLVLPSQPISSLINPRMSQDYLICPKPL